jgi:hypothetical protein
MFGQMTARQYLVESEHAKNLTVKNETRQKQDEHSANIHAGGESGRGR